MEILYTILIGLLVGMVAKFIMPGRDPGGLIITILLGIGGSFLARYAGQAMKWYPSDGLMSFIASVLGAIAILAVYRMIAGRRR